MSFFGFYKTFILATIYYFYDVIEEHQDLYPLSDRYLTLEPIPVELGQFGFYPQHSK